MGGGTRGLGLLEGKWPACGFVVLLNDLLVTGFEVLTVSPTLNVLLEFEGKRAGDLLNGFAVDCLTILVPPLEALVPLWLATTPTVGFGVTICGFGCVGGFLLT